jgi:Uma2 family endonuclease
MIEAGGAGMAASVAVPVGEYLRTSYRPDCEYVDGEVQERNLGERDHADLQTRLAFLLCLPENEAHVTARTELRVQVKETRFRVPDVCVLRSDAPWEAVVRHPPLLCIEVLSPDDTVVRMGDRVRDYLAMGVRAVWVVDPAQRSITVCVGTTATVLTEGELAVPETPVVLRLGEIFKVLDRR